MDTTTSSSQSNRSFGYTAIAAVIVGLFVIGFGLLLVPQSVLGGAWIAVIGVAVLLAGLFSTPWTGRRFGLTDGDRGTLTLSFVALAAVLAIAFAVINGFGSVESFEVTS